jgi:hypothetical protein
MGVSHECDAGGIGVATEQGILGLEATPHLFVKRPSKNLVPIAGECILQGRNALPA